MMKSKRILNPRTLVLLAFSLVMLVMFAWPGLSGSIASADDGDEIPFDEASIFFELNDTDGDLGIHALIDGEAWKELEIEDPREREILDIMVKSRLRRQGLTELFFESAEPPFESDDPDEVTLTPEEFFLRFPAGTYEIEGETLEGDELESEVELSHVMPAPPDNIKVNGQPVPVDCEEGDVVPVVSGRFVIRWDPVTTYHPEIGEAGPIEVAHYQLVVEREEDEDEGLPLLIYSVDLPPDVTRFPVPAAFTRLGGDYKFEILVRAENGNQTAVETSCFEIAD